MKRKKLNKQRAMRKKRSRKKVGKGTNDTPRLSVFRSNKHIYAQLIDDYEGKTLVSSSSFDVDSDKLKKTEESEKVGEKLAKKAKKEGIEKVIFDKGPYKYHGRVKALAEGAREEGLNF